MRRIYSPDILRFIDKIKKVARAIIQLECGASYGRSRVTLGSRTYPIEFVCFEHHTKLGHFDSGHWQIGLNRCLMARSSEKLLEDVVRHELAHYFCHIRHGNTVDAHGREFRQLCRDFGWGDEISKATWNEHQADSASSADDRFQSITKTWEQKKRKLEKLLALGQSGNVHEAEQAMARANRYLAELGLSQAEVEAGDPEDIILVASVYFAKRRNALASALSTVLRHFCVEPVYSFSDDGVDLEVTGRPEHVEFALYLADVLARDIESLWEKARKQNPRLKGKVAKNSFIRGVAEGIKTRLSSQRKSYDRKLSNALIKIESELSERVEWVYGKLSALNSGAMHDQSSYNAGKQSSAQINLNRPLSESGPRLLT